MSWVMPANRRSAFAVRVEKDLRKHGYFNAAGILMIF